MGAIRSDFTKNMNNMLYEWYMEQYDTYEPVYPQIFEVVTATEGSYHRAVNALGLGKLSEKKETEAIKYSSIGEGWEVITKYRTFADGITISADAFEDSTGENLLRQAVATWSEAIVSTKEDFAASFFNKGGLTAGHDVFNNTISGIVTDSSGNFIYDGKPFFALSGNNHTAKGHAGTYYNAVALSLTSDNLQTVYNLLTVTNNRNEKGEIVKIIPDTLLIPPALKFTADGLLGSTALVGGSTAAGNKNVVENLLTPVVWQYLTSSTAWFVGKAKKGIKFYERKSPVINFYQDEDTLEYKANIHRRYGASVDNWRFWAGSNVATS